MKNLTEKQSIYVLNAIRTRMDYLSDLINKMDNGDIAYSKSLYDEYYNEYHSLYEFADSLSM